MVADVMLDASVELEQFNRSRWQKAMDAGAAGACCVCVFSRIVPLVQGCNIDLTTIHT